MTKRICPQCKEVSDCIQCPGCLCCSKFCCTYTAAEIRRMLERATNQETKLKWSILLNLLKSNSAGAGELKLQIEGKQKER